MVFLRHLQNHAKTRSTSTSGELRDIFIARFCLISRPLLAPYCRYPLVIFGLMLATTSQQESSLLFSMKPPVRSNNTVMSLLCATIRRWTTTMTLPTNSSVSNLQYHLIEQRIIILIAESTFKLLYTNLTKAVLVLYYREAFNVIFCVNLDVSFFAKVLYHLTFSDKYSSHAIANFIFRERPYRAR